MPTPLPAGLFQLRLRFPREGKWNLNISLRPAEQADSEFIFRVKKAALGHCIALTWGWDETYQRSYHEKDFDPAITDVIRLDSADAGWMIVTRYPDCIVLGEFYLLPDFQNQGIGSRLISSLIGESESKCIPLTLSVLKVNRARAFYERHGFVLDSENAHHYAMVRMPREKMV